jgi:hypothetical protein
MRLILSYHFVALMLLLMVALNLNCQRIKTLQLPEDKNSHSPARTYLSHFNTPFP